MAIYNVGQDPSNMDVSEDDILKHTLLVGVQDVGKTNLLKHLAEQQLDLGRSLSVFDSSGDLYEHVLRVCIAKGVSPDDVIALDSTETKYVLGFNPLTKGPLDTPEHCARMTRVTLDAAKREGLPLTDFEAADPLGGAGAILSLVTKPGTYFYRSVGCGKSVDFATVLRDRTKFLAKLPKEEGSTLYGMLLFDALLIAAERAPQSEPHLVFVDEAYGFLASTVIDALDRLTANRVGLVIAATYGQLAMLKLHQEQLYWALLQRCSNIAAFRATDATVQDIVLDVARRLYMPD